MPSLSELDELRFKIIKKMLTEFPQLRQRVQKWLEEKREINESEGKDKLDISKK